MFADKIELQRVTIEMALGSTSIPPPERVITHPAFSQIQNAVKNLNKTSNQIAVIGRHASEQKMAVLYLDDDCYALTAYYTDDHLYIAGSDATTENFEVLRCPGYKLYYPSSQVFSQTDALQIAASYADSGALSPSHEWVRVPKFVRELDPPEFKGEWGEAWNTFVQQAIINPSMMQIEAAIRRLDGDVLTDMTIGRHINQFRMNISGGRDDQYLILITQNFDEEFYLCDSSAADTEVEIVLGGQEVTVPGSMITGLAQTLQIARTYAESGRKDQGFAWLSSS